MTSDAQSSRADRLIIDPRYNGPDTSGNGGWVAGSLARLLGKESVSVSLRAPAPLAVPMLVRWRDDGVVTLEKDGTLIAEAGMAPLELDVPTAPDPDEAEASGALAKEMNAQGANGPYAHCFACGLARSDGLRIVPGPLGDDGIVATSWSPPQVTEASDQLSVEATWAALDCSAGFAWMPRLAAGTPIITARMTAVIDQPLHAGHRYTVIGWPIAHRIWVYGDGQPTPVNLAIDRHDSSAVGDFVCLCKSGRFCTRDFCRRTGISNAAFPPI
jgi:hypothetical protein